MSDYIHNIDERIIRAVNNEPRLQSALYDCNMLPEQIQSADQELMLATAVNFYMLGKGCWAKWMAGNENYKE